MLKHTEALATEQAGTSSQVSFPGQGGDEIGEGEGVGEDVRGGVGESVRQGVGEGVTKGVREGVLGSIGDKYSICLEQRR